MSKSLSKSAAAMYLALQEVPVKEGLKTPALFFNNVNVLVKALSVTAISISVSPSKSAVVI